MSRINELTMHVGDEHALRQAAHEETLFHAAKHGGIASNEMVDNDQQAADLVGQNIRMAVTMGMIKVLRAGGDSIQGLDLADVVVKNEPSP